MRARRVAWGTLAVVALAWRPAGAGDLPAFVRVSLKAPGLVTGIRAADFDGDGHRDLFVVAGRKFLLFRQRAGRYAEWADAVCAAPAGTVLANVWVPRGGPPQVICIGRRGVRTLAFAEQAFAPTAPRLLKITTAWRAVAGNPVLVRPVVRDLTGDGRADLLVPLPDGYAIYELRPGAAPVRHARVRVRLGTRVALLEQSRGGALYTEAFHPPVELGDANGDGRPDLVVRERGRLAIFERDAAGRLPREPTRTIDTSTAPHEKKPAFRVTMPVTVADITGDGVLDYVQAVPGDGTLLIYDGAHARDRTDLTAPDAVIRTPGYALGAVPRDLDGDGRLDLLVGTIDRIGVMGALQVFVAKSITVHSLLYYNREPQAASERFAGRPDDQRQVEVPLAFTTTTDGFRAGTTVLVSFEGDFDGDGRRDLLQRLRDGALGIWRGRPARRYAGEPDRTLRVPSFEGYRFVIPHVLELNGDGRSDLVLHYRDWEDQQNRIEVLLTRSGD